MLTKTDIEKYFIAEKQESLVFLVIGIIAVLLALIFYFVAKTQICRGAALPLLILGLIQAVAGYTVYVRSDDQRVSQVYAYDMNPDQLKTIELTRMRKVKTNFGIYRWIEIALSLRASLIILFRNQAEKCSGWNGIFTLMVANYSSLISSLKKSDEVYLAIEELIKNLKPKAQKPKT
jgi:hypothetical protein